MTQPYGGAMDQPPRTRGAIEPQARGAIEPQARYILPSFIEHSSFGVKESNPYNKLFE